MDKKEKYILVIGGATIDTIINYQEMETMEHRQEKSTKSYLLLQEGKKIEVLVENKLKNQNSFFGRAKKMTPVIFESTLCNPGDLIQVNIISSNQNNLFGIHLGDRFKAA